MEREVVQFSEDGRARGVFRAARGTAPGPAVVLIVEDGAEALGASLAAAGFAVLEPEFSAPLEALADRSALAELENALAWLARRAGVDGARLAAVGRGRGGTLAFLLGCTSRRVAAVVNAHGPVLYPALAAARPTQPLELALNLSVPLLAIHGAGEDVALLRALLEQGAKHVEFASEDRDGRRTLAFLREVFELDAK